ncbi:MAG: hypothetical protein U0236_21335 [Nitrospira sp.]
MARTFRALRNPVRGARVVGHGKNTLSLIIETDRGSYRWDIKPIFPFEVKAWISRFKENWRSALKRLVRESEQSSTSKLNPSQSQLRYGKIVIEQSRPQKLHSYKPTKIHPVYYRWRVYLNFGMTTGPSASGRASTHRAAYDEAYEAYKRLVKDRPRMLFNEPRVEKRSLKYIPKKAKILVDHLYDPSRRPQRAFSWRVYLYTTFTHSEPPGKRGYWGPAASGLVYTLEEAYKRAYEAVKKLHKPKARMLFNPGKWRFRGWRYVLDGYPLRMEVFRTTSRYGNVVWNYKWYYLDTLVNTSQDNFRTADEAKRYAEMHPEYAKISSGWQRHGSTFQRPVHTGILQVARSGSGSFVWTFWKHLPKTDQYKEMIVDWRAYKYPEVAKEEADKWYMKRYKGPVMLFNKVRR